MKLHQKKCVSCEGGMPPLTQRSAKILMKQLKDWQLKKDNNIFKIYKEYRFKTSQNAVKFMNDIGKTSNKEGHHPVATWVYNKVSITFWTHAINGLFENDFIMAAKFDKIYNKYKN